MSAVHIINIKEKVKVVNCRNSLNWWLTFQAWALHQSEMHTMHVSQLYENIKFTSLLGYLPSVAYLGGACGHGPPRNVRKFFWRDIVKNGISNLYILFKCALKMQEMPFQRPKIQNISGGACPRTPYNCVATMASPSLKSWLRYCFPSIA